MLSSEKPGILSWKKFRKIKLCGRLSCGRPFYFCFWNNKFVEQEWWNEYSNEYSNQKENKMFAGCALTETNRITYCRWCGSDIYDDITKDGSGFWCAYCDGFTYFDNDRNRQHRMLLILETDTGREEYRKKNNRIRKRISPLRYPGGKSKMTERLLSLSQPWQMDTFVEVFAGGASVGLNLLDAGCIKKLVMNDADPNVYAFWKTVMNEPGYLTKKVGKVVPTRELFFYAKEKLSRDISERERAWYFFLVNRTAFSGIQMANPMGDITCRWNPQELSRRITKIAARKEQISLYNMDACDFLEQYAYWRDRTTLFLDPPYYEKGPLLYPKAFTEEDHERLAEMTNSLYTGFGGPDMILTYDQCQKIEDLYPWAETQYIGRGYSCKRIYRHTF